MPLVLEQTFNFELWDCKAFWSLSKCILHYEMAISLQREICFACEIITQVHAPKHWSPGDGAIMDSCRLFRRQGLAAGNWFLRKRALNIVGLNYGLIILLLFTKSCHHFFFTVLNCTPLKLWADWNHYCQSFAPNHKESKWHQQQK